MNIQLSQPESTLDARARRAANRIGLRAIKSRKSYSLDNLGGYMLVTVGNCVWEGARFELTAEDVINLCAEELAAA